MLDFSRIRTPANHGDTLVEPAPGELIRSVEANHARLATADFRILDVSGQEVRRQIRREIGFAEDTLAIITGHQPDFIHPGVWAKHVIAERLARAVSGVGLNLVVDSDAPHDTALYVPAVRESRLTVAPVRSVQVPPGVAFEEAQRLGSETLSPFEATVRDLMGERFNRSMMPVYLQALRDYDFDDWVGQSVAACRAVEHRLGVHLEDLCVSRIWLGPLLGELMTRAADFAVAHNRALAEYRRLHRVRNRRHPVPDLLVEGDRLEVPAWVYRRNEPRRRLFVEPRGDAIELFAERESLGVMGVSRLRQAEGTAQVLASFEGVRFRPRALSLTLWARLFLADLFIHGIGGAKYDRVTDAIIREYFGVMPPAFACVSATLLLDLPRHEPSTTDVWGARHRRRDLRFNPQRYVPADGPAAEWLEQRARAIAGSLALRQRPAAERRARRQAFQTIHALNDRIAALFPGLRERSEAQVREAERHARENALADRRDFFFALFSRDRLQILLDALPQVADWSAFLSGRSREKRPPVA